jgi:hypothetical protein
MPSSTQQSAKIQPPWEWPEPWYTVSAVVCGLAVAMVLFLIITAVS